ncbi:MAG TPA: outer membrane beta-barrel protein [Candidatus Polarisedimenticolia bacterium]|jgi:hypothetical protein|nr:outer membrane beta-barrel protein [Candidatus Polarisedimenticolia bacterium]
MRRTIVFRGFLLAFMAAVLSGHAWAQNRDKAWEVTPELGWIQFGSPHLGDGTTVVLAPLAIPPRREVTVVTSDIDDSLSYGFRFGYHWTKSQMIEFGFSGTATDGVFQAHKTVFDTTDPPPDTVTSDVTKSENVSIDLIVGHANYVYNFFMHHRGKVVGFVTGGIGIVNTSIFGQTADPDLQPILDGLVGDENSLMFNYGAGIRFFGSEKAGLRFDIRQVRYDSSSRTQQDHLEAGIALTLVLGGA